MILGKQQIIKVVADRLPWGLKPLARMVYLWGRHRSHPVLKEFGTVQDLYYWVSDDNFDTLLLLQNYYSAFYPSLDTATEGTVSLSIRRDKWIIPRRRSRSRQVCRRARGLRPAARSLGYTLHKDPRSRANGPVISCWPGPGNSAKGLVGWQEDCVESE